MRGSLCRGLGRSAAAGEGRRRRAWGRVTHATAPLGCGCQKSHSRRGPALHPGHPCRGQQLMLDAGQGQTKYV